MKKIVLTALTVFLFTGCGFFGPSDSAANPRLVVKTDKGDVEIQVEIADTFEERKKGLMARNELADKKGMYFIFESSKRLDFWMKNTLIPLDIIFIDSGSKVLNIAKNVQPCKTEPCAIYSSIGDGRYALEIRGGQSDVLGIQPGDTVQLAS